MGDMADAMLSGEFDSITREYLGPGVGYPRTNYRNNRKNDIKVWECPCGKHFSSRNGLNQHKRDVHLKPLIEKLKQFPYPGVIEIIIDMEKFL